jgi:hypothetical protein
MIRITERTHKLSCIMSNPPVSSVRKPNDSDALSAAEAVLALAYKSTATTSSNTATTGRSRQWGTTDASRST